MYRKPLQKEGIINKEAFFETAFVVDEDRLWRRWQLAPLVSQEGHLTVVPSMQLLTALAELHSHNSETSAVAAIRQLKTRLNEWAKPFSCDIKEKTIAELCRVHKNCPDLTATLPQKKRVNDKTHVIDLAAADANDRIVYRFAPADKPNSKQRTVIDIERAKDVLTYGINAQNQIVFIGATHEDNKDRHPIPIRVLTGVDGVYLVANATDTLLRFGRLQPHQDKIIAFVVVLMTLIFTVFNTIFAHILSFGFLFIPLFIWTFYQLHQGIVIDIALYSLAIQIIQILVKVVTQLLKFWTNNRVLKNKAVSL
ncbi:MAG: hypothetical protein B6247_16665 [Candidatus Parabeggiatoa sp. nov. 2]|nr:MAG: hypothetical protein B6247_16665 [Beggiatoa sp. 4572_84]